MECNGPLIENCQGFVYVLICDFAFFPCDDAQKGVRKGGFGNVNVTMFFV